MDVPAAPIDALVLAGDAPPPHIFELGRLPFELRMHIIQDAARELNRIHAMANDGKSRRGTLLLVNREFHAVAAPLHWDTIHLSRPATIGPVAVRTLIKTVLPRYGVHVKSAHLACSQLRNHWWSMTAPNLAHGLPQYDPATGDRLYGSATTRIIAQVVLNMPNLTQITMGTTLQDVVASSPHLASLTHLEINASGFSLIASNLASIINHSPNLVAVSLLHVETPREEDHHLLVKALASHQALTTLTLDCYNFLDDTSAARWICPLTTLTIISRYPARGVSITTFLSYFSSTLLHLHLPGDCGSWFRAESSAEPVSLPRLVTLSITLLHPLPSFCLQDASRVPSLFDDSPIEDATLFKGLSTEPNYPISPMLLQFVRAHQGTLKILRTTLRDTVEFERGSQLPGVIALVHRAGIKLEGELWEDMHPEDCSVVDGEEEERKGYGGDDDETEPEWVKPRDWMDDIEDACEEDNWYREPESKVWDLSPDDPYSDPEVDDVAETVLYGLSRDYPRHRLQMVESEGDDSGSDGDWIK